MCGLAVKVGFGCGRLDICIAACNGYATQPWNIFEHLGAAAILFHEFLVIYLLSKIIDSPSLFCWTKGSEQLLLSNK